MAGDETQWGTGDTWLPPATATARPAATGTVPEGPRGKGPRHWWLVVGSLALIAAVAGVWFLSSSNQRFEPGHLPDDTLAGYARSTDPQRLSVEGGLQEGARSQDPTAVVRVYDNGQDGVILALTHDGFPDRTWTVEAEQFLGAYAQQGFGPYGSLDSATVDGHELLCASSSNTLVGPGEICFWGGETRGSVQTFNLDDAQRIASTVLSGG